MIILLYDYIGNVKPFRSSKGFDGTCDVSALPLAARGLFQAARYPALLRRTF
jgi:hypothetical protein